MTATTQDAPGKPGHGEAPPPIPAHELTLPPTHRPLKLRQFMAGYTGPTDLDGQLRKAAQLATARSTIPRRYQDNPGDIHALMEHAIALNIALSTAMRHLHFNPEGVGGMSSQLMHALVIRAGHRITPTRVDETAVRMVMDRCDGMPSGGAQWTLLEAQRASLHTRENSPWVPYPSDMLWARCMSRLCRRWAPDVVLGFYVTEDLDDLPNNDVDPVDLSTAMRDVDGNLVPAPDVVNLLDGAGEKTYEEIRMLWRQAGEEGLLGVYAGTIDQVHHTVEEVLFNLGTAAQLREQKERDAKLRLAAAQAPPTPPPVDDPEHPDADLDEAGELLPPQDPHAAAEHAPAGTGDCLPCGCLPAAVMAAGGHQEGCTRGNR